MDESSEDLSEDALERRRLRDAEEWWLKQMHAGVTAEENPNFQARAPPQLVRLRPLASRAGIQHREAPRIEP